MDFDRLPKGCKQCQNAPKAAKRVFKQKGLKAVERVFVHLWIFIEDY
jgi:hypothetical protein